jgi:hypothetical protein
MAPKTFSFPHGASGIELGDFVIQSGKDKVVLLTKGQGEHYTLQAGHASGVLDIHHTREDLSGNERHQTVFAMRRADLADFLNDLMPMTTGMLRLVRRLRLGWLYRNDIGIVVGLEPVTDKDMAAITRRRRKRLVVDEDVLQDIPGQRRHNGREIWDTEGKIRGLQHVEAVATPTMALSRASVVAFEYVGVFWHTAIRKTARHCRSNTIAESSIQRT